METNNSERPLVTIFTLVYNTGKYVLEALESLKAQTYTNIQHIIIDDCSKDDSVALVENWIKENNHECTFIKHEVNQGVTKTLNEVLALSKGKYTGGLSDDIYLPEFIEKRVKFLEQAGDDVAMVYSNTFLIDEQSEVIGLHSEYFHDQYPSPYTFESLLKKNNIAANTFFAKIDVIREMGGWNEKLKAEDHDMWLNISKKYKILFLDSIDNQYRIKRQSLRTFLHSFEGLKQKALVIQGHLGFSKAGDQIIRKRIQQFATASYLNQEMINTSLLKISLKESFSIKIFLLYLLASLGISGKSVLRLGQIILRKNRPAGIYN